MTTDKEILQAIKNYILSKQVFALFDTAIKKRKDEIGKTDQEIHLKKIPNYRELKSALAPMVQNRLNPQQIYMSPVMAGAIDDYENDLKLRAHEKTELYGLEVYKTLAVDHNVIWALPDYWQTGVMAIPKFGMFNTDKDLTWLENYADFPDNVKKDSLFKLANIEAPYKITVPQRWIDDYLNIRN